MWINAVFVSAMMLVGMLVQTAVLPAMGVTAVAPEILMSILILSAIYWKPVPTALIGVFFGLVMDALFGRGIGMYSLPYLVVSWAAPLVKRQFDERNIPVIILYAVVCYLLRDGVMLALLYLVRTQNSFNGFMVLRSVLSALLTGATTLLLCFPMIKWFQKREAQHRRFQL
ncbi:MAG: rod shape-determining protein MreD [Eubacteriales bacterium]|nr:rod shape-determining protein MreD [Eubacteriales bacterium]